MKKSVLLLAAFSMAGFANGQAVRSVIFEADKSQPVSEHFRGTDAPQVKSGYKTTAGPGGKRWYDYVDSNFALNTSPSCPANAVSSVAFTGLALWNDTTSVWGYTGTPVYSGLSFTSVGLTFDPYDPAATGWNNPTYFPGQIIITPGINFTIDSVAVLGWYNRNFSSPAKDSVKDTLILTFVQGTASTNLPDYYFSSGILTDYCAASRVDFLSMLHDSVNNRAGNLSGTTVVAVPNTQVFKFVLTKADTNGSNVFSNTQYPRPGHWPADPAISFPVTGSNYVAMSVTFKSGDPSYPSSFLTGASGTAFPGRKDTVRYSNGTSVTGYKYGCFDMAVAFNGTTSSTSFPPYGWPNDHTSGYFKRENDGGWGGQYIPNWAWTSTGGASDLQFPYIMYHVNCPTCYLTGSPVLGVNKVNTLDNVSVTPNPANNEIAFSFTAAANADANVSLSNTIGQVVASRAHVSNGEVVFNTASLPAGIYIYTIQSNGEQSTGRVVIAH